MARNPSTAPTLVPGQQIGGCRIERLIGTGGMGEVYLAQHLRLQRPVALKTLRSDSLSADRIARFVKEARICARIDHPNVVTIHDVDQQAGLHFIVMQYVEGKDLDGLLREQGGPLPWPSALRLIRLAAKGLQAVHREGLVHRDIKPSNIMLSQNSRVLLMDFGLAREESQSDLTQMNQVVGTPAFMSPEQLFNTGVDGRSDIYSLGGTLYCLLTGVPPFLGRPSEIYAQRARGQQPRPLRDLNPHIPRPVAALVEKALAEDPAERYRDTGDFIHAITRLLKSTPGTAAAGSIDSTSIASQSEVIAELLPLDLEPLDSDVWERARTYWPWIAASVAAVVLTVLALGVTMLGHSPPATQAQQPSGPEGMVYIPAGRVVLGNNPDKLREHLNKYPLDAGVDADGYLREVVHGGEFTAQVPPFWMDRYEVTNADFARFLQATGHPRPAHWETSQAPRGKETCPVENVSYRDAEAYARWAGKSLPSREQWVRAFRGDSATLFPWGDTYAAERANVFDSRSLPRAETTAIDATPGDVSPFGVRNLVGNVIEYIRDSTPGAAGPHACRGGGYGLTGYHFGIADAALLVAPTDTSTGMAFGFRCVVEQPPETTPDP